MPRFASLFIGKGNESADHSVEEKVKEGALRYKILFVDDEENVLNAMKRIFRRENYALYTASSGPEALEFLKNGPVNIVISDHKMPGMTGADLLRKIKALYPQTIRIMLTGHADVNAVMGAVNEGAVYKFITKPWNDEDLRLTVSLALEQYDLIKENRALKEQQEVQKKKIKRLTRFANTNHSQIGHMLLRKRLVRKEDLDRAMAVQRKSGKILPLILIDMGLATEKVIMKTIQAELGTNQVDPNEFTVPKALASLIPKEICENTLLVPLKKTDGHIVVAMADPSDYVKLDELRFITGVPINSVLCTHNQITEKIQEVYGGEEDLEATISELDLLDPTESIEIIIEDEDEDSDLEELLHSKNQPPAIRIVNAVISDALRHGASDVHIEPKTKYVMVRYRIDGLLRDKIHIPPAMQQAIVSRIKVMSELDISERRKPQDGRVTVKTSSRMVDMRISTLPTINGEKVVLRILDKNAAIKDISVLGLSEADLAKVTKLVTQPQGILLATGPTGSGKTSTLYSLLQKVATITKNFTTIEDPVEYFMGMAEQVSVRGKIGLNFPIVLRAILRQDPNVIMLGEIRDFETAEVAFHAALTGHLVLSTLHTNGSIASITRLRDMGIKPYVISEALIGIIAQRLLRRVCTHCKTDDNPSEEVLRDLDLSKKDLDFIPKMGAGCDHCSSTGYNGRIGIFEVFQIDGELKKMIHRDATEKELMRASRWAGMTTLLEDALGKVKSGITTCEEVLRVLGPQYHAEIQCPQCKGSLKERFHFCPFCGCTIIPQCKRCSGFLESKWRVCPYCGEKSEM